MISFSGKMSAAGELKSTWPETWWELGTVKGDVLEQLKDQRGYEVSGPGINKGTLNFVGCFDGDRFFADMHIVGFQVAPGSMEPHDVVVDGPIKLNS